MKYEYSKNIDCVTSISLKITGKNETAKSRVIAINILMTFLSLFVPIDCGFVFVEWCALNEKPKNPMCYNYNVILYVPANLKINALLFQKK